MFGALLNFRVEMTLIRKENHHDLHHRWEVLKGSAKSEKRQRWNQKKTDFEMAWGEARIDEVKILKE